MLILGKKQYTFDDCDEDPLIINKTATPSPLNSVGLDYERPRELSPEALQAAIQQLSMSSNQLILPLPTDHFGVEDTNKDETVPKAPASTASSTPTPTASPISTPVKFKPFAKRVSFSAEVEQKPLLDLSSLDDACGSPLAESVQSDSTDRSSGTPGAPGSGLDPVVDKDTSLEYSTSDASSSEFNSSKFNTLDSKDSCYVSEGSETDQRSDDDRIIDSSLSMAINSLKLALEYYKQQSLKLATASLRRYQDALMFMTREDFQALRRINELRESIHRDLLSMQIKLHHQLKDLQQTTPPTPSSLQLPSNSEPHHGRNEEFKRIRNMDKMIGDALAFAEQVRNASSGLERLLSISSSSSSSAPPSASISSPSLPSSH